MIKIVNSQSKNVGEKVVELKNPIGQFCRNFRWLFCGELHFWRCGFFHPEINKIKSTEKLGNLNHQLKKEWETFQRQNLLISITFSLFSREKSCLKFYFLLSLDGEEKVSESVKIIKKKTTCFWVTSWNLGKHLKVLRCIELETQLQHFYPKIFWVTAQN